MTTKEMEQMLGITKAALIYYEKEGFIKPERGNNNYRNYTQKDVETIKFIMMMRSMQISIDEIKLIFNGELSIRDALDTKQEYLKQEHLEIEQTQEKIKNYVKRHTVIIQFNEKVNDEELLFREYLNIKYPVLTINDEYIYFGNTKIKVSDINKIKLSMCSQVYPYQIIKIYTNYYVDIDFITSLDTYSFQIMNNTEIRKLIDFIKQHQISIEDCLDVVGLYEKYDTQHARNQYLDVHFQQWAKDYHLDNPRKVISMMEQYANSTNGIERAQVVHDNFKKDLHHIKNLLKIKK